MNGRIAKPPEGVSESIVKETWDCSPREQKAISTAQILAETALTPQRITKHLGIDEAMDYRTRRRSSEAVQMAYVALE